MVSPVVAYLAHEDCPVTGECFAAAGGSVKRVLMSQTRGIADPELSIGRLTQGWDQVMDEAGASVLPPALEPMPEGEVKPYRPLSSI